MKAALNGALNLSVLDGWWEECFDPGTDGVGVPNGWAISGADTSDDERRSELDSDSLFELLEHQVLPLFNGTEDLGHSWSAMVRRSLETLGPQVDAHRMMAEYIDELYAPAARMGSALAADAHRGAKELAAFNTRVSELWRVCGCSASTWTKPSAISARSGRYRPRCSSVDCRPATSSSAPGGSHGSGRRDHRARGHHDGTGPGRGPHRPATGRATTGARSDKRVDRTGNTPGQFAAGRPGVRGDGGTGDAGPYGSDRSGPPPAPDVALGGRPGPGRVGVSAAPGQ
ncbi:MAG: hypothetical protein R2789_11655 [Microthrixaceae bacterium]